MKQSKKNIILFIITTIITLLGLFFIIFKPISNLKNNIPSQEITRLLTYEVYLKDNPYYDSNPLKNNIYASNSIDYLNINFNYNYQNKI